MDSSFRKLSKKQANLFGKAQNTFNNARVNSLLELSDPYSKGTMVEKMGDHMSSKMGNYSLINYWND